MGMKGMIFRDTTFRKAIAVAPPSVLQSTAPPMPSAAVAVMEPAIAAVAVVEPPAPVPIPDASIEPVAAMSDALRREYMRLVTQLELVQPGLLRDEARAFFRDRGTRLYDEAKVSAFLTDQFGTETPTSMIEREHYGVALFATWGWRGLRRADALARVYGTPSRNGTPLPGQYDKPVPLPVLLTVEEVAARFSSARFFVSDKVQASDLRRVDDPFLMVLIEDDRFIIERWDEPAYRE